MADTGDGKGGERNPMVQRVKNKKFLEQASTRIKSHSRFMRVELILNRPVREDKNVECKHKERFTYICVKI